MKKSKPIEELDKLIDGRVLAEAKRKGIQLLEEVNDMCLVGNAKVFGDASRLKERDEELEKEHEDFINSLYTKSDDSLDALRDAIDAEYNNRKPRY